MDISIGCGGLSDLKSYLTIRVHKSNAEACKTNQMLSAFYASKKDDNMDRNNARASSEVAKKCSSVARGGGRGGYSPPPIGMSTKMQNEQNTTFLALLRLFYALEWTK